LTEKEPESIALRQQHQMLVKGGHSIDPDKKNEI
jgi:hypothetical protein